MALGRLVAGGLLHGENTPSPRNATARSVADAGTPAVPLEVDVGSLLVEAVAVPASTGAVPVPNRPADTPPVPSGTLGSPHTEAESVAGSQVRRGLPPGVARRPTRVEEVGTTAPAE